MIDKISPIKNKLSALDMINRLAMLTMQSDDDEREETIVECLRLNIQLISEIQAFTSALN